jgi:hypothetical protein
LTVYRYSREKVVEYTSKKVNRLSKAGTIDASRTMTRELARDGLMEDGKEALLECKSDYKYLVCPPIAHIPYSSSRSPEDGVRLIITVSAIGFVSDAAS